MLTGRRFRKYLLGMYGLTSLKDLVATQPIFYKTHSLDCTPAPRSVEGRASRATIQRGPFSSQRPAGCVLRPRLAPATGAAAAPRASPRRGSGGRAAGALHNWPGGGERAESRRPGVGGGGGRVERRRPPAGVPAARAALAPGSPAQRQPGGPRPPAPSILHLPQSCELSVRLFHRAGTPGPEGLSPRRRSLVVLNACERGPSLQVRLRGTRDTVGLDHLGRGGRGRGQQRRKPSISGRGW